MNYIIITGGVISGIGKGISASSIGYLLKKQGLNVTIIKIAKRENAGPTAPAEGLYLTSVIY